jgi:hypothetical protein
MGPASSIFKYLYYPNNFAFMVACPLLISEFFMRFPLAFIFTLLPALACAAEAPQAQTRLLPGSILRGHFVEERQIKGMANPMHTEGHFTLAPPRGLLWSIEKPFPTTTIITQNNASQDIGGLAVKLPAKNLRHIYDMVGGALAGDWSKLENDFNIAESGGEQWQIVLTPKSDHPQLDYSSITVTGSKFVESIVLVKPDGGGDSFTFSDPTYSKLSLTQPENILFSEAP